ncbi:MAG: MGMT family protein [Flavobacteriaceae bacterium]|nr:MGMT family protein [Flavobacteriaceae bacterium]
MHYYDLVYHVVRQIPNGRISTYGRIADYLTLGSARMVGWALNQCHGQQPPIPAHRVVNRKGELSGRLHFGAPNVMQNRLEAEGHSVVDNKIVDFEKKMWHPEEIILDMG